MFNINRFKTILTFFAHPDDETLAAGATLSKLSDAGADIHIAIPATGIHSRRNALEEKKRNENLAELRKDCETALSVFGIPSEKIYLGSFSDNEMDKHTLLELIHWLEDLIEKIKPDIILTHHRYCTNIDHQYCHNAVVVATRPSPDQHICVLSAEVPSSTGYLRPARWEPNLYIGVTQEQVNRKIKAMSAYRGEARPDPHPRSREVLNALAKVRGSESGFHFAESFMIQKCFG